jgi:hypothetical protein
LSPIAALLMLVSISMLLWLLVGILVALVLLGGRRVGRVSAIRVVALVILAMLRRSAVALLLLLVCVVGRCLVCALVGVSMRFRSMRLNVLTWP